MHTYARGCSCVRRHLNKTVLLSGVTSRGLKLENKTYKLKRSIIFSQGMALMKSCLRWTSKFHYQASEICNNNYNLKSDLDADDLLEVCV